MVDFLHYGMKKHSSAKPAPVAPKVVMAESTAKVLEEEQIVVQEEDTVQEVVEKVNKSKKLHAKVTEGGKKVKVKRVLND